MEILTIIGQALWKIAGILTSTLVIVILGQLIASLFRNKKK